MEAQLILATVASRYRLRLPMGYPVYPKTLITLVPRDGLRMTAEQRQPVPVA
jgi:cytochrome P450